MTFLSLDCRTEENEAVVRDSTFGRQDNRDTALLDLSTKLIDLFSKMLQRLNTSCTGHPVHKGLAPQCAQRVSCGSNVRQKSGSENPVAAYMSGPGQKHGPLKPRNRNVASSLATTTSPTEAVAEVQQTSISKGGCQCCLGVCEVRPGGGVMTPKLKASSCSILFQIRLILQ